MDGIIENIDIADGILLTTSEFVSQEDIEMTTTHDDLSLFQISFCIDGNMEWSYINNEVVHQFQIAAQQSQVRYGTFKECRSKISGNRKFKGISITLDEKIFEQIFTCIKIRGAVNDYVVEKRLEAAIRLLKTGKHTVQEVTWMVGYSHTGYFIELFRKHYGISPGEMLKNNR